MPVLISCTSIERVERTPTMIETHQMTAPLRTTGWPNETLRLLSREDATEPPHRAAERMGCIGTEKEHVSDNDGWRAWIDKRLSPARLTWQQGIPPDYDYTETGVKVGKFASIWRPL